MGPVELAPVNGSGTHLNHVALDFEVRHERLQRRAGHPAGSNPRGRFAGGGPAAAAIVPDPVFLPVSDVGVSGAEFLGDIAIVFRALIGVFDHQLNRRAGRDALECAGQNLNRVGLAALRRVFILAGFALVEPCLDHRRFQRDARRAAIDGGTKRRPVTFAPGRDAENMSECIQAHGGGIAALAQPLKGFPVADGLVWF